MHFRKYTCAFLYAIDETIWDFIENGQVRSVTPKAEWNKVAIALANTNNKAINATFDGVSTDEFHRISHTKIAQEVWKILKTTYKEPKRSKTPNYKCSLHGLRKRR